MNGAQETQGTLLQNGTDYHECDSKDEEQDQWNPDALPNLFSAILKLLLSSCHFRVVLLRQPDGPHLRPDDFTHPYNAPAYRDRKEGDNRDDQPDQFDTRTVQRSHLNLPSPRPTTETLSSFTAARNLGFFRSPPRARPRSSSGDAC